MYPSATHPTYGIFVKNFVEQMSAEGFQIEPVVIQGRGRNVFEKLCKYIRFLYRTVVALARADYDLVYAHYIGHSLLPFLFTKKRLNTPWVINAHGGDVFAATQLSRLIQKIVSPVIRKADLVVVPSVYFSQVVAKKHLVDTDKIFVSPSGGVDGQLFKPASLNSKKALFTIGYVSRIDEGKGWDVLLLAVDRLRKSGIRNFEVLMAGGGAQVRELEAMLRRLNLDECVRYVGPIAHHELPTYYRQMDIFVFPTRLAESLGLVGLEALACGIPVVGSAIGALPEYIKPGYNGQLFSPGDVLQLAECLQEMLALDNDELEAYKNNAVVSAKRYDSKAVSQAMKVRLEQLIAHRTDC